MKKYLFCAAIAAAALVSCNKDKGGDGNVVKELEATFTMTTELASVVYAEPVEIVGTAASESALDGCTLVAVKKSGETYTEVGEAQEGKIDGDKLTAQFFTDSKEMTDIAVTLKSSNAQKTFYCPVGEVTGELKGHVYLNDAAQFMADDIVKTHDNDPETFPEPNTGAGSDTKSFFSMHGVEIDGKLEHILSLNQLRAVDGKNGSFVFMNCMGNTGNATGYKNFSSQAGYMFSGLRNSSLKGGTTNRQCDIYEVNGHAIKDANIDYNFEMKYVRGSWAGESYHPEVFTVVDDIFLKVKEADTPLKEMKAFWELSRIQKELDSITLGAEEPTTLGGKTFVRKYTNAGKSKSAIEEVFRAGDYIVFRSQRGTEEEPVYYYGIMQVVKIYDDSSVFATDFWGEGYGDRISPDKAEELNRKPLYLDIKCQFEVPAK